MYPASNPATHSTAAPLNASAPRPRIRHSQKLQLRDGPFGPRPMRSLHGLAAQAHVSSQIPHQHAPHTVTEANPNHVPTSLFEKLPYDIHRYIMEEAVSDIRTDHIDHYWPFEFDAIDVPFINSGDASNSKLYLKELNNLRQVNTTLRHVVDDGWQDGVSSSELIKLVNQLSREETEALQASRNHPEQHEALPNTPDRSHAYYRLRFLQKRHLKLRSMLFGLQQTLHLGFIETILDLSALQSLSLDVQANAMKLVSKLGTTVVRFLTLAPRITRIHLALQQCAHQPLTLDVTSGQMAMSINAHLNELIQADDAFTKDSPERHILVRDWFFSWPDTVHVCNPRHLCSQEFIIKKGMPLRFVGLALTNYWAMVCPTWRETQLIFFQEHHLPMPQKLILQLGYSDPNAAQTLFHIFVNYLNSDSARHPDSYIQVHLRVPPAEHRDVLLPDFAKLVWRRRDSSFATWINPLSSITNIYAALGTLADAQSNITKLVPKVTKSLHFQLDECQGSGKVILMEVYKYFTDSMLQHGGHRGQHDKLDWNVYFYSVLADKARPKIINFFTRTTAGDGKQPETHVRIDEHLDTKAWAETIQKLLLDPVLKLSRPVEFGLFDPSKHYASLVRFNQAFSHTSHAK